MSIQNFPRIPKIPLRKSCDEFKAVKKHRIRESLHCFPDLRDVLHITTLNYQTDNITPPVAKTLFQNIWEIFENMKTQKKTFEKNFLEISKPWIDAREAREKFWAVLGDLQGKITKNSYF